MVDKVTGYQGKFEKGGTLYAIRSAQCDSDDNERETTSSDDEGYTNHDRGNLGCEGRIEAVYAPDQVLTSTSSAALRSGSTIENVKIYPNGTSGKYWDLPKAKVGRVSHSIDVQGDNVFTFNFRNKGPFTPPE